MLLAHVLTHIIASDLAACCARRKGTRIDEPWPANADVQVGMVSPSGIAVFISFSVL